MIVQFTDPDEFNNEMRMAAHAEQIAQKVIRITQRTVQRSTFPVVALFTTATYIWRGHIIRFDRYHGDLHLMAGFEADNGVRDAAEGERQRLCVAADALGLTTRDGVILDKSWFDWPSTKEGRQDEM